MDSRLVQGRAPYPEQVRASISKSRDQRSLLQEDVSTRSLK